MPSFQPARGTSPGRSVKIRRMRKFAAVLWGAAVAAALIASCGEPDRLPPVRGGAGATGGAGVGAGGSPTTTGSGGSGPGNLCECVAEYGREEGCGDCWNVSVAPGNACAQARAACDAASGCTAISQCIGACGTDTDCQKECVFPADGGPEHELYRKVLACMCGACGSQCTYGQPLECPAWSGTGGAGGAGGTGGAGGAGGAGGMGGAGGA